MIVNAMWVNGFGIGIVDQDNNCFPYKDDSTGARYIYGDHGDQFGIRLYNNTGNRGTRRTTARGDVYLNGDLMGSWIVKHRQPFTIWRPANEDRAFHILDVENEESNQALAHVACANMGLVKVVFYPERKYESPVAMASPGWQQPKTLDLRGASASLSTNEKLGAAGTGLGDATGQQFSRTRFDADLSRPTVIMVRLAMKKNRKYGSTGNASPYPPPIR